MDVLTLSFPTTTDTLRVLSSIRRAAESVVNKELRIERDVSTAISIRQLIWKAKVEISYSLEQTIHEIDWLDVELQCLKKWIAVIWK